MKPSDDKVNQVIDYYIGYDEEGRLSRDLGQIEYLRSQNIIQRFLQTSPAVVLDVGGAAGRYSCWLAKEGYQAHLVDVVPLHLELAQKASAAQPNTPVASFSQGDARQLEFKDECAEGVLLMGPLYHLTKQEDRIKALKEAYRVLKKGGVLFAAGISRFASTIDGLVTGECFVPAFLEIMHQDLKNGQHQNPTKDPHYFTDTFFHHPDELRQEVASAGFEVRALLAVEGISYMMKDFEENWQIERHQTMLLEILQKTESEPSLIGASPHVMCVGQKV